MSAFDPKRTLRAQQSERALQTLLIRSAPYGTQLSRDPAHGACVTIRGTPAFITVACSIGMMEDERTGLASVAENTQHIGFRKCTLVQLLRRSMTDVA
jgi:hypothetical protein